MPHQLGHDDSQLVHLYTPTHPQPHHLRIKKHYSERPTETAYKNKIPRPALPFQIRSQYFHLNRFAFTPLLVELK